jgi:CHRD domain
MFRRALIASVFTIGLIGSASAATLHFQATLDGKSEVPPTTSAGTGQLLATLDTTSKTLSYTLTFENLTGPATAAHFHGPAAAGASAGVAVAIGTAVTSPMTGTATLTDDQIKGLTSGKWYVNIHTDANKGGEIRGQVMRTAEGGAAPAKPKPAPAPVKKQ